MGCFMPCIVLCSVRPRCMCTVVSGISRKSSRITYCGLVALSLIVSWILR